MSTWPIGKTYDGRETSDLPSDYLDWIQEQEWFEDKFPELFEEVKEVMAKRDRMGTHWNRWEEEINLGDELWGDKW